MDSNELINEIKEILDNQSTETIVLKCHFNAFCSQNLPKLDEYSQQSFNELHGKIKKKNKQREELLKKILTFLENQK